MKKDNNNKGEKARIRVFFGEIEGDNATIQESLRSIGAAVSKTFQSENTIVKVISANREMNPKELEAAGIEVPEEGELIDEPDVPEIQDVSKNSSRTPSRPRKPQSYTFVKELNLRPSGKQSLKEFYAEKKPGDQQQIFTVVIYYLYRVLEISNINKDHIYSCLKEIGVRVPGDILGVVRQVANRKNFIDSGDSEHIKTTTTGDNFVELDLPISKSKEQ